MKEREREEKRKERVNWANDTEEDLLDRSMREYRSHRPFDQDLRSGSFFMHPASLKFFHSRKRPDDEMHLRAPNGSALHLERQRHK